MLYQESLNRLLAHAVGSTPYYRERGAYRSAVDNLTGWNDLPLLEKETVQEHFADFLSEVFTGPACRDQIDIRHTSGSTGQYLNVYWYKKDTVRAAVPHWLIRRRLYGIGPTSRMVYFYTTEYQGNTLLAREDETLAARDEKSLGFCKSGLTDTRLRQIIERMKEYRPDWIQAQPSVVVLLADCAEEAGGDLSALLPSLRMIELTGETLPAATRERLSRVFGCPVVNFYGCNEMGSIALDTGEGFRCFDSNVYLECLSDGLPAADGDEGDLYATTLTNRAMPLIRYRTGDRGRLWRQADGSTRLELTSGRTSDFIVTPGGRRINAYVLLRPVDMINQRMGEIIRQFQVIQEGPRQFRCRLAVKEAYRGWGGTLRELFIENLREDELKEADWTFEIASHLFPADRTGKLAFFLDRRPAEGGEQHG